MGTRRQLFISAGAVMSLGIITAWSHLPYLRSQEAYDRIRSIAAPSTETNTATSEQTARDPLDQTLDWNALRSINPDVIGWIRIPNTAIDYPIVQARPDDPEKYLHTTFEGAVRWPNNQGTIYLDARNESYGLGSTTPIIYGHFQLDGSMFSALSENFRAEHLLSHDQIFIYTPHGNLELKCFMARIVNAETEMSYANFPDQATVSAYLDHLMHRAEVVLSKPSHNDGFFTFVTCSYTRWSNQRTLTYAYVVRDLRKRVQSLPASTNEGATLPAR